MFLLTIYWLFETLKDIPEEKWSSVVLAYANICHLYSLKASHEPLATLASPYDKMWMTITKVQEMHTYLNKLITIEIIVLVIDSLHISNHKAAKCHDL